ncbi:4-carboxy-4-hydroxy-2-oxoadipate aldolase/oxaloacetate decarboxylase [Dickeya solani]|uniref:Putative 4-hydroxy-4-methyl-2-oxoglutarate aldolase n=1 Tax=Dickeya solani TaxID=1089444 RepID=A0AAX4F0R0_9GAMM|nr:4-carboxy-4-hydroxy-2-oxoadipate aldolase/oxaloacetate decarboxylase [Dickeya solani]MCA6999839.1 4-carboxy-4-hydroxy-2-oxoadipate aldolase/oxaloacetate decarboxylase [Dickeya solani]MCZ0820708.1 4-carboxy-4-hydroxy-2-oxoadipate aldolase/oxaloacetate decarboxylase [Dickeya solani]MDV6995697.1 4-carboxy-4-hydroxy-2-oxoadipate aldolase/oxaloacetate decarboxylase [Dickeya solani]MDV7002976.1 4-carboxy-4-hydroxy-2-oxoadipate aldolase/oxaloacetate decarboxylase [Dickeya solani]MDV7036752.1 4-car
MTTEHNRLNGNMYDILKTLGAATVYEAQGATGAIDAGIKPIARGMKIAGPALTVEMRPGDNLMIHYALLQAKKGDVLVINCQGFIEAGVWGDVLTSQAQFIGLAGLVVNGAVRDSDAIIDAGFPVFSRGISIKGTGKHQPGKVNETVVIGDCIIHPGDIIVGDSDGLVVIDKHSVSDVIELAKTREEKETHYKEKINHGATTAELMGLNPVFKYLNLE